MHSQQPNEKNPAPVDAGNGAERHDRTCNKITEEGKPFQVLAQANSLSIPNEQTIRWLMGQGVSEDAMLRPWVIKSALVRFLGPRVFEFEPTGQPALIFRAEDRGECFDLLAWQARSGRLGSWRGAAFALGDVDDCFNPGTFAMGDGLRVHETPLEWLLAERDGVVIVRPALEHAHFRNCPRLLVANVPLARRIRQSLNPPKPRVSILIDAPVGKVAA